MGIERNLGEPLDGSIVAFLGKINETHAVGNHAELIPVFASEHDRSQVPQASRVDLCSHVEILIEVTSILNVAHIVDIRFQVETLGKLLVVSPEEGIPIALIDAVMDEIE